MDETGLEKVDGGTLNQPQHASSHPEYERECQAILAPHLQALIDRAVAAGWDRSKVGFSLMYLAAKGSRDPGVPQ